jgi:putative mRNA 3-end processing factor
LACKRIIYAPLLSKITGRMNTLLTPTPNGLYCPAGDFTIDPRHPVPRAVITHAHADHARGGSGSYLCAQDGKGILQSRLGPAADIRTLDYGAVLNLNGVGLSLHPAGHVLGAAQVRLEKGGYTCVVSGDYKTVSDPTCRPLEPLRCQRFISESTFGLPIFRWPAAEQVIGEVEAWWRENQAWKRTSVLFAYALGKAQRILASLAADIGPILTHGAIEAVNQVYRESGVALPPTRHVGDVRDKALLDRALVLAPPSADNPAWLRRFPQPSRAFASGWMRIRGNRRRRALDRGFVMSDHADWDGLVDTITASGAERVDLTHGYAAEMARRLREQGVQAAALSAGHAAAPEGEGK